MAETQSGEAMRGGNMEECKMGIVLSLRSHASTSPSLEEHLSGHIYDRIRYIYQITSISFLGNPSNKNKAIPYRHGEK